MLSIVSDSNLSTNRASVEERKREMTSRFECMTKVLDVFASVFHDDYAINLYSSLKKRIDFIYERNTVFDVSELCAFECCVKKEFASILERYEINEVENNIRGFLERNEHCLSFWKSTKSTMKVFIKIKSGEFREKPVYYISKLIREGFLSESMQMTRMLYPEDVKAGELQEKVSWLEDIGCKWLEWGNLDKAIELNQEVFSLHEQLRREKRSTELTLTRAIGMKWIELGDLEKAKEFLLPGYEDNIEKVSEVIVKELVNRGKWDKATEVIQKTNMRDPNRKTFLNRIADKWIECGDLDKATENILSMSVSEGKFKSMKLNDIVKKWMERENLDKAVEAAQLIPDEEIRLNTLGRLVYQCIEKKNSVKAREISGLIPEDDRNSILAENVEKFQLSDAAAAFKVMEMIIPRDSFWTSWKAKKLLELEALKR